MNAHANGALLDDPVSGIHANPGVTARRTDLWNAEQLIADYGLDMRYVSEKRDWITWEESRWQSNAARVARFAMEVTRRMMSDALAKMKAAAEALAEASASNDPEAKDRAKRAADDARRDLDWAATSQSAVRLRAMLDVAKDFKSVRVSVDELDADPMLLNVQSGTVDLRTGKQRRHRRTDLLTKICPVVYDAEARSPLWEKTLRDALGDNETVTYFQRSAGYSCTGLTDEEKLFVPHGPAAGGKSTLMQAIIATLGDYARTSDFETFLIQKHAGGPKNDVARLAGARFVVSIEVDQGKRLAQGLVKQLTGGDVVTARFLYSEAFEFKPQMKLWLVVNDLPHVSSDDSGMWRRIERIPFEHVVPKEKRDPAVKKTLCNATVSGPAILAWLVQGALAWQRDGLRTPARIVEATQEYRSTEDHFAQFVAECCTYPTTSSCTRRDMRAAYDGWYGARGPLSQKAFNEKVRQLAHITETTKAGVRFWVGISLRTDMPMVQKSRTESVSTNSLHARDQDGELSGKDLDPAPPAPDGYGG